MKPAADRRPEVTPPEPVIRDKIPDAGSRIMK
ncbi:MAG: hypothetical protein DUW69_000767 [Verrucomicrobia bacterium]|jgi:hypothetical protein|nr:MAG: hypothetical protein DUW69_000767 [Verrucomicrobiota bacterium]